MRTKILLIGLDGGSADVLRQFAAQGHMPFLDGLFAKAPLRALESIPPYATPAAWASIYTGVTPADHGVLDFVDPTVPGKHLVNSTSLKAEPFWQRLSAQDRRIAMIAFPLTYPPKPINGVMVSGLPAPHQGALWSWPPEFDARLKSIPGFLPDPEMSSPIVNPERSISRLERHIRAVAQAALAAHKEFGGGGWDVFGVQFQALDAFQHMFWAWIDPNDYRFSSRPEHERQRAARFFTTLDEALRQLIENLNPQEIVILSDHGFGSAYEAVCPNPLLLQHGLLTLSVSEKHLRRSLQIQRLLKRLDVFNLRARMKFSAQPRVTTRNLSRLMRDELVDEERSPAYVFSGGYCGLVKIQPGFEATVRDVLLQARHPVSGHNLIKAVLFPTELWNLPQTSAWRHYAIIQAEAGFLIDSHFREYGVVAPISAGLSGTHRPTGILWTTLGTLQGAKSILDIAPGLLHALNISGSTSQRQESDIQEQSFVSPEDQAIIEQRLRQLGYL